MAILSIDTSDSQCAAALWLDGEHHSVLAEDIGRGHAERLLPMVESLMTDMDTGYVDLHAVAVVTGPGTFTGLRIGLSVARGIACGLNIPCYGFTALEALALSYTGSREILVHAVVRGRGGQAYHQAFKGNDAHGVPMPVSVAINEDADKIAQYIQDHPGQVLGSGTELVAPFLPTDFSIKPMYADLSVLASVFPALQEFDTSARAPEPYYLRPADAVKAKPVFGIQVT